MSRRAALYARVSTNDQHTEPPLHALRASAAARSLEVSEEHVDRGVSGAKNQRGGVVINVITQGTFA